MSVRYYTRTVIEHFRNPRNQRAIDPADGEGRALNRACSDLVRIYISVAAGKISDCSFQAQGCAACIAASSMTTELVQGLSVDEARSFDEEQVVEALGGLPESKVQCSVIAPAALRAAVQSYESGEH
ncbi:MAG: iron-sulfur cluster assembly scaffold protein [Myxococcota bacterium]|nr:iron-sulfur cluster assembly scaffold protein [Myxococcota bacterium]